MDNKLIAEIDYYLGISSYVVAKDTREIIDIKELNNEISNIVKRQSNIRTTIDQIMTDIEGAK